MKKKNDKSSISLIQARDDSTVLTLHDVDGAMKTEGTIIDHLSEDTISGEQENGAIRLVPIELPDGSSGWVAINA
uniref:Uncharacterized protein n=1 Tax=Pararge aegeria TaxID=116150 RepID=S4P193_9NEOP